MSTFEVRAWTDVGATGGLETGLAVAGGVISTDARLGAVALQDATGSNNRVVGM